MDEAPPLVEHDRLRQQLDAVGLADGERPSAAQWSAFLATLDASYASADREERAVERRLREASTELQGLYDRLQEAKDRELAVERAKLAAVLDSLGDGLALVDAEGWLLSMNPAGRAMLGVRPEAIGEHSLWSLLGGAGSAAAVRSAFAERRPWRDREVCINRADGRRVVVSAVLTPLRPPGDTAAVFLFHDVREQRAAAAAMQTAREEAEAHSRLQAEFLATMSHEIRTPMHAVIGMTALLLDSPLDPQQREYAEIVRASGRHLLSLIDSIQDFSRIESGTLEIDHVEFDVGAILDDVLELFSLTAASKGLELVGSLPAGIPRWRVGDPARIRQVLINLVDNAVKFTESGEVVVSVADEGGAGSGGLRFSVRDTGIGIEPGRASTLFQPFVQADGGTTRRYGGSGLGLAICRQLAEIMGGRIGVDSTLGGGSTFWFTAALPVGRPGVGGAPTTPLAGRSVLVVDDHPAARHALVDMLRGFGAWVSSAGSGGEALSRVREQLARAEDFDLVLVDAGMPGLEARALVRTLREDPRTAGWILGLLTPAGHALDEPGVWEDGIAGSLSKPVRRDDAAARLAGWLQPHRATPTADEPSSRPGSLEAVAAGRRVLVAEDTPVNQLLVRRTLERFGVEHDIVANGREAVDAAATGRYALVLMDCMMPEMDGYEASRTIRMAEEAEGSRLAIVAMTANVLAGAREGCLAAGMDDYLGKPVEPEALRSMLRKWLGADAQAEAAPPAAPTEPGAAAIVREAAAGPPEGDAPEMLPVLRWEVLEQFAGIGGDRGAIAQLVEVFMEDATARVRELQAAALDGDATSAASLAHAVRSGCGYLGAEALGEACLRVESAGRSGDVAALPGRIATLCHEFARLEAAVQTRRLS